MYKSFRKKKKKDYVLDQYLKQVEDEIKSCSKDLIDEFKNLFPRSKLPRTRTIILKGRSVGASTMVGAMDLWNAQCLDCSDNITVENVINFWNDWLRFKKLKYFL